MALPIWAIFMNKVYDDGTLGITRDDKFEKPLDFNENFDCLDVTDKAKGNDEPDDNGEFM